MRDVMLNVKKLVKMLRHRSGKNSTNSSKLVKYATHTRLFLNFQCKSILMVSQFKIDRFQLSKALECENFFIDAGISDKYNYNKLANKLTTCFTQHVHLKH